MQKLTLGLDIGVSSVGWGIIDENSGNIIDCAARIFPQSEKDDNLTRRTMRGSRRLTRRRKHRLERVREELERIKKVWIASEVRMIDNIEITVDNICSDLIQYNKVYENRIELIRELNMKELKQVINNLDTSNQSLVMILPNDQKGIF